MLDCQTYPSLGWLILLRNRIFQGLALLASELSNERDCALVQDRKHWLVTLFPMATSSGVNCCFVLISSFAPCSTRN